jgi:hypothetical protein
MHTQRGNHWRTAGKNSKDGPGALSFVILCFPLVFTQSEFCLGQELNRLQKELKTRPRRILPSGSGSSSCEGLPLNNAPLTLGSRSTRNQELLQRVTQDVLAGLTKIVVALSKQARAIIPSHVSKRERDAILGMERCIVFLIIFFSPAVLEPSIGPAVEAAGTET